MSIRVKCLIVDDREENLLVLEALLHRDDVEVLKAHSGAEALDLLLSHDVALALLDVQMPEMDGFELAELMRGSERTRHVPIIFVTAGSHDQRRVFRGYESGAVDFLYKPIEPHILANKAAVFFQLYRQTQQIALELEARTERLRLNEMFTAVLGHDLRNPLNAIMTGAQLLEHSATDDGMKRVAGRMLSSARRMSRMIEDLLDLARARLAGGIPLKRERTELGAIVQRLVQEHQTAHATHEIALVVDGDLTGHWDADRLAQATSNLLGNAIQHGHEGRIDVTVRALEDSFVAIAVTNRGSIPPELLPNLFDPFRGGQRPTHRNEGLGLGLYIVQQVVLAHQGRIDVTCEDGVTTFRITLPRETREVVRL
jgi:signal transduction histidine kinase